MKPPINPRFRFREREIKLLLLKLRAGDSVLISGLRRIGKSWIIKQALSRLDEDEADVAYLDIEDLTDPAELIKAILDVLPKSFNDRFAVLMGQSKQAPDNLMDWLKRHFKSGAAAGVGIELNDDIRKEWKSLARLLEKISVNKDRPFILALDEVPFFLENLLDKGYSASDCKQVLAFLRKWRDAGIQMVFGGSVNLENMLTAQGITRSVLGGLDIVEVLPFSDEEMMQFLNDFAEDCGLKWWNPDYNKRVREAVCDAYPYFAKLAMDHVGLLEQADGLDHALQEHVIPDLRKNFLYQFEERLGKRYVSAERDQATRILDQVARNGPQTRRELQSLLTDPEIDAYHLLNLLQRDDFLRENADQRFNFSLLLLRRYWRGKLGLE